MLDVHCHMLPGLDDGSPNWEQTLAMARIAVEDGIKGVVCTPHWIHGMFDNTRPIVLAATELFRTKLRVEGIPLTVYPGSELRIDFDLAQRIGSKQVLTLNDSGHYALIELPEDIVPQNMAGFFWNLQSQGITPMIAHPERNRVLIEQPERLYRWVEMGVLTQLTTSSILGRFGKDIRNFSISLLEHNLVHVLATDSHGVKSRTPRLAEGLKQVEKIVGKQRAREMVFEIPECIIGGVNISTFDPIPFKSRSFRSSLFKRFFSFGSSSSR